MPKITEYRIEWSKVKNGYEVIHGPFSFDLIGNSGLHFWMEQLETFHFCSPTGHALTMRKEKKKRGGGYWYTYKRVNGKVKRKYFGDRRKIDLQTLETLARQFVEPAPQAEPEEEQTSPPPPPPRQPTLKFTNSLQSALQVYGLMKVPNKKVLIERYRDLSKQYHPDRGGMHEDMVAVNLAYDYLKKFL